MVSWHVQVRCFKLWKLTQSKKRWKEPLKGVSLRKLLLHQRILVSISEGGQGTRGNVVLLFWGFYLENLFLNPRKSPLPCSRLSLAFHSWTWTWNLLALSQAVHASSLKWQDFDLWISWRVKIEWRETQTLCYLDDHAQTLWFSLDVEVDNCKIWLHSSHLRQPGHFN